ncbi:MAG: hypothetical protein JNK05_11455 [Myxococcales bacterium]|nr:hypothetical protein [Myxococcales bacterium]
MKHNYLAGAAVLGAALAFSTTANAQNVINANNHGMAGALNFAGGYGYLGGGGRLEIEYQFHFNRRYEGPGIGLGIQLPFWAGFGIGFQGRFIYDIQPISNVAFFITPYGGLSLGFWNYCEAGRCGGFWVAPELGLELKVVLFDRLLLGFRPIGISIPFAFGGWRDSVWWGYHAGFTIGVTF